nr:hypothetical protein [uncultured Draconibacterium sp.]
MKKLIKILSFFALQIAAITLTMQYSDNQSNEGFGLNNLYKQNLAYAEDPVVKKYKIVACGDEEEVQPDGTTIIFHRVRCAGDGETECKCYC